MSASIPDARDRAQRFVDLHAGSDLFVMANPTNVGTARLLEDAGYQALGTSSAALARSLGRTDGARQVTRREAVEHAVQVMAVTSVPVSGDFENGYGDDPHEVAATVQAAVEAGLAGCCIEDATGLQDPAIYDAGLARDRIQAGAEAIGDWPFVLVARAENHLHGRSDLRDTIQRLQSFEQAGAGAVYAPGLIALDEIRAVVKSVSIPVNVLVGLPGQTFNLHDLAELGVRRVSVGSGFERLANDAIRAAATGLQDRSAPVSAIFGHD